MHLLSICWNQGIVEKRTEGSRGQKRNREGGRAQRRRWCTTEMESAMRKVDVLFLAVDCILNTDPLDVKCTNRSENETLIVLDWCEQRWKLFLHGLCMEGGQKSTGLLLLFSTAGLTTLQMLKYTLLWRAKIIAKSNWNHYVCGYHRFTSFFSVLLFLNLVQKIALTWRWNLWREKCLYLCNKKTSFAILVPSNSFHLKHRKNSHVFLKSKIKITSHKS